MNRLNKAQKDKVVQFSEKAAYECLKLASWGVDAGIDYFYTSGQQCASSSSVDPRALEALYQSYKASGEDMMLADGVCRFCEDLEVDPADVIMLIISYHMNAAVMCEFSKEEFTSGMLKMGCDSVAKLKLKIPELRKETKSNERFRELYNFAYLFAREKDKKFVSLETANAMWQLLFSGDQAWPLIADWCAFLEGSHAGKAISKDTWSQLLDFAKTVKADFSNYDDNSAWPYLLDEFVDHVKAQRTMS
ncbi:MAG: hypothetical protein WDW38_000634 [Sanguina aurantia]